MLLTPNLNGTSRERLIEQRCEVGRAALILLGALEDAWPNGRDYQLRPENMKADVEQWNAFASTVRSFRKRMEEEAFEISQQEDACRS